MDKKQFFQSLITSLPDNSGHRLGSLGTIQTLLTSLKSNLSDTNLQNEFEPIEQKILFHIWMLEQICNGEISNTPDVNNVSGPLIVISVSGEILFVNRVYCKLSGLTTQEIQAHAQAGTLYDEIYIGEDVGSAQKAVSRLQSGKGYKHLELSMKFSNRKIAWSSYGGVGTSLEIRSGREIYNENDQKKERERFYRGSVMNSAKLIEDLYQISANGILSEEDEQHLMWIQELLSMFDFLWNHSELFLEIIDMPTSKEGKVGGSYNTVYAQFIKSSFEEGKKFKNILSAVHGMSISELQEVIGPKGIQSVREAVFHQCNRCPVAKIHWQCATYPHEILAGHTKIFSIGLLVHKIQRKNIFVQIFRYLLRKDVIKN